MATADGVLFINGRLGQAGDDLGRHVSEWARSRGPSLYRGGESVSRTKCRLMECIDLLIFRGIVSVAAERVPPGG